MSFFHQNDSIHIIWTMLKRFWWFYFCPINQEKSQSLYRTSGIFQKLLKTLNSNRTCSIRGSIYAEDLEIQQPMNLLANSSTFTVFLSWRMIYKHNNFLLLTHSFNLVSSTREAKYFEWEFTLTPQVSQFLNKSFPISFK